MDPLSNNHYSTNDKLTDHTYQQANLKITGMSCAACSARIEKGLSKLPGVKRVNVNLTLESGQVEFVSGALQASDLIHQIRQFGYEAYIQTTDEESLVLRERELQRKKWKWILSAILSFPLLWSMVSHFSFTSGIGVPDVLFIPIVQWLLATPVQFYFGATFYKGACKALKNRSANMDVLVALGTSSAYFYSVYLILMTSTGGCWVIFTRR